MQKKNNNKGDQVGQNYKRMKNYKFLRKKGGGNHSPNARGPEQPS